MIILIEILFLIFGIVFNKNGLLITTLVLSSFLDVSNHLSYEQKRGSF